MESQLYPFKCDPLLKEKLWGGTELRDLLQKTTASNKYGESWEVASLPEGQSTISNGIYRGQSLGEIILSFPEPILGKSVVDRFGAQMPLLIKFIDASKKLSVQLHPDDDLAKKLHNKSRGKTEMWYVLKASKGAHIIAGFNEPMDITSFEKALSTNTLVEKLHKIPVQEGDAFYIPAGLLHAIGEGIVLAEIQQTSDITYRVFDYNRKQKDGTYRDLHLDNAIQALKFPSLEQVCLSYDKSRIGLQTLKETTFFTTNIIHLQGTTHILNRQESFTVLIGVEGEGNVTCNELDYSIKKGDTYLIPAGCDLVEVSGRSLKFLEVYT